MLKEVEQNQPIIKRTEYFVCENCKGVGFVDDKKCSECNAYALGVYSHNDFLFWGKVVSQVTIWQEKIHKTINQIVNFVLFIFGIIGFGVLGYKIFLSYKFSGIGLPIIFDIDFWLERNWYLFVFWISVMVDLFIYFRLVEESRLKFLVKHKDYNDERPVKDFSLVVSNWREIKLVNPKHKIDVSQAFNREALEIIDKAYLLAKDFNHKEVTTLHVLAVFLASDEAAIIFGRLGVDFNKLRSKISGALNSVEKGVGRVNLSTGLRIVLIEAYEEAYYDKVPKVTASEILLVMAREDLHYRVTDENFKVIDNRFRKISREILYDLEVDEQKIKNVVLWLRMQKELQKRWQVIRGRSAFRPKHGMDRAYTATATPYLNQFCADMTQLAAEGYLDLCVGREKEINNIFRLIEGGKNGLILVGLPGVGKKTIIEGIAQLMISDDVPKALKDKRLVSLSVARLISNATASEASGRLMRIIHESNQARNIILFIENIDEMGGLSAGGEQTLDLNDVVAKIVSQNALIVFATSNTSAYTSYIEPKNLGQVMQKIDVQEVNDNDAVLVLEAKSSFLEAKNRIFFSYGALVSAVQLTKRYVFERYLPEKAINIIEESAAYVKNHKGENSIVTAEDVSYIVSQKVNIPLSKVGVEESEKLLKLEEEMHKRMIGQDLAVNLVAEALRRARAGLSDQKRPIANFLFLGPTGVGKTELAKTVAESYFDNENNMIRLDMSEYQEQGSIDRLIGVPGSKQGGLLTEAVRRKPFALLLLDELEKAHPDILNVFLQVMDDGRLTDSLGRTISFTNVILIATSNAGTQFIQDKTREGVELEEIQKLLMHQELKRFFKPEFLNRFDGIVVFKPLDMSDVVQITKLLLQKIAKRLGDKGINLEVTDKAIQELAVAGFDPIFGARPLRRVLQDRVDNVLAKYLLQNKLDRRDVVVLDTGDELRIKKAERY